MQQISCKLTKLCLITEVMRKTADQLNINIIMLSSIYKRV